jgi:hypothetical protein
MPYHFHRVSTHIVLFQRLGCQDIAYYSLICLSVSHPSLPEPRVLGKLPVEGEPAIDNYIHLPPASE